MIDENIFEQVVAQPYDLVKENIQVGDLIFCSGEGLISGLIKEATDSQFSHVGILLQLPVTDQWLVLESVEDVGVRCVTLLQGYVKNYGDTGRGYAGRILIARHSEMQSRFKYIESLYSKAFDLVGDKYSREDIFKISTRIALNKIGIHEDGLVKDNERYICSEYVYACLKAVGIALPYNPLGFIAPADIARDPAILPVAHLQVDSVSHRAAAVQLPTPSATPMIPEVV